jgi:DNA-binding transcriptional ArsR family regulator
MGERFVLYRLPGVEQAELARRSLAHVGNEGAMRRDLRQVVSEFFIAGRLPDAPPLTAESDIPRLVHLAVFAVTARSSVERDGYSREIELIPAAEAPTRLVNVLARMLASLRLIGCSNAEAWETVTKLALDSIPQVRRDMIGFLAVQPVPLRLFDIAEARGYPKRTTERALEDLTAHGVVTSKRYGAGKATEYRLSDWAEDYWGRIRRTSPDMSDGINNGRNSFCTHTKHISGEVADEAPSPYPFVAGVSLSQTNERLWGDQ